MTIQVAMIAADGWVLASDRQGAMQGSNWKRHTYETEKIVFRNGVVSAVYGDECAIIARGRILDELKPTPDVISDPDFQKKAEKLAVQVWETEATAFPGISAGRDRGIIFMTVGQKVIRSLAFGKLPVSHSSSTRWIGGDKANVAIFFSERYYDIRLPTMELAVLAAHTVVQAARFNPIGIRGLDLIAWQAGRPEAEILDSAKYEEYSRTLDGTISDAVGQAMQLR
jgi:hypothetical protein